MQDSYFASAELRVKLRSLSTGVYCSVPFKRSLILNFPTAVATEEGLHISGYEAKSVTTDSTGDKLVSLNML